MRFVVAIVLFVLAFMAIGLGIAQRTILAGPDSISLTVTTESDAPLTLIDGAVLNAYETTQGLRIEGSGEILLATGRTADVLAWVGDARYNEIGYDAETGELTTRLVEGTETEVPSPAGADLWAAQYSGTDELTRKINVPSGVSALIASDGTAPAPADITITWPLDNSTPWSSTLVIGGVLALIAGLAAFVWALVHARRRRGPRRTAPRVKNPKPPRLKPPRPQRALGRGQTPPVPARSGRGRRRIFSGLAAGAAVVALAACGTADPVATPTPLPSEADTPPTAVTESQLSRIVAEISQTVAEADEARDPELAERRLTGAALELRTANYAIRGADSAIAPLTPIPDEVEVALPRQTDTWPRTVFAVASDPEGASPPVAMILIQEAPRDQYRAAYVITLGESLPDVAPPEIGAPQLDPENRIGILAPSELASAYGDILLTGEQSESFELFESEGDELQAEIGFQYKQDRAASIPSTATIEFGQKVGDSPVVTYATNDTGQICAVELREIETVRPLEAGAAVNPTGAVKALSGVAQTTKGVTATYGLQLLFYVPPVGADDRIVLLGYSQGLVAAQELP